MTTTGTTLFNPAVSDLVLEAYQRCGIRATSLTPEMTFAAHLSANLALAEWNVKGGPSLWKVQLLNIPLQQGVATYQVPTNVISILDYYIRQFTVGTAINFTPAFSTTLNSTAVTVNLLNHGFSAGEWVQVGIPVSVGGMIIFGFYQVTSIVDVNNFTITPGPTATSTVSSGGAVPLFATTAGSTSVQVTLNNNGLGVGSVFPVQVATAVGGVSVFGSYNVVTIIDANNFTITAATVATSSSSASENGGKTTIDSQVENTDPIDRVLLPISRSEYSQQPDKFAQAFPTTVWFDRLINPTVTLWPVPDNNGPYTLYYYALTQMQDATLAQGLTADMPIRFLEAFAAELAARLAVKFAPARAMFLRSEAERTFEIAAHQDQEEVPLFLTPGMSGYFR